MGEYNDMHHSDNEKLPPRSIYHAQSKGKEKNNYRVKMPIIKLLSLIVVIAIIAVVSINLFSDDKDKASADPKVENNTPLSNIGKADDEEDEKEEEKPKSDSEAKQEDAPANPDGATTVTPAITETPAVSTQPAPTAPATVTPPVTQQPKEEPKQEQPKQETKVEYIEHVVTAEENLYRIAMKYFKSPTGVEIIQKHNGLKDTTIKEGQKLKIPKQ